MTQAARVPTEAEQRRLRAIEAKWRELCERARADVNVFLEMCFCDDQTPGSPPFKQQPFHREWQAMWSERISVIHGPTGFGKTDQLIGRVLWELGRDPSLRVAIVRKSFDAAKEIVQKIKRQIEQNKILRAIFPHMRAGNPWSDEVLRLEGAGLDTTTNSVTPFGLDGPLLGKRVDLLVIDDANDPENTRTEESRKKGIKWADEVAQSRLTTHGRMIITANAWHREDIAHTYAKRRGVAYKKYQAEDPVTGELLWPSFRGREYLDALKNTMSPTAYARTMLCELGDDATRIFSAQVIARALLGGAGLKPVRAVQRTFDVAGEVVDYDRIMWGTPGARDEYDVLIGVDLATGETERRRKTDFTVLFDLGVHVDTGRRRVLWIEKGRYAGPHTVRRLGEHKTRYSPRRVLVESNAQQRFLLQFLAEVPGWDALVTPFHTDGSKWSESLGIEGIAGEMMAGRWQIPGPKYGTNLDDFVRALTKPSDRDKEIEALYLASLTADEREAYDAIREWVSHLFDFQRSGHTADDVMASWFARVGALKLAAGMFEHTRAAEMATPPPGHVEQQTHGPAPTTIGLFEEMPEHIRAQLGL